MATRGTAAKSASGASMSQYDVEVEARLKAIEATIAELKSSLEEHLAAGGCGGGSSAGGDVEARLDDLIARLNKKMRF